MMIRSGPQRGIDPVMISRPQAFAIMLSPPMNIETDSIARGILLSLGDDRLVLGLAGTDYQLQLRPTVPASQITTPIGKRIRGTIHAQALRMFKATGGGRFIEPIIGEPRIVAGLVLAVDQANRRLLVDVAAPMWMSLATDQPADEFAQGELVNCYVESGTRFTPA